MADGRTTRWEGHREQRRAQLVEVAAAVIDREGPGATVGQIADALKVSRQALYRQFEDRADLDRAIAQKAADDLLEALLPRLALENDFTGGIAPTVRMALTAYLDHVQSHLNVYRFVRLHEADVSSGTVASAKDTIGSRIATLASELLVASGLGPAEQSDTFAVGVVGMADAVMSRWLEDPAGVARDDLVDRLVVMVTGTIEAVLESLPAPS